MFLGLRFEQGEVLPVAGTVMYARGFAGVYRVRIRKVTRVRLHPTDGATLLDVDATRRLVAKEQP